MEIEVLALAPPYGTAAGAAALVGRDVKIFGRPTGRVLSARYVEGEGVYARLEVSEETAEMLGMKPELGEVSVGGGMIEQPMRRVMGVDAPDFGPVMGDRGPW